MQEMVFAGSVYLPPQPTSFIGRTRERAELEQLVAHNPLVTLTGAGGCGKTRLALRVATDLTHAYVDGVRWVDLATLSDPALVPAAVARALNLSEQFGPLRIESILDFLSAKKLLLVLDNCEHLLSACAELVQKMVRYAPEVHVLATSRVPLAVNGETRYPVSPLPVPAAPGIANVEAFDAVRLFVERARRVLPAFDLNTDNASFVAEICRRLDGIPLALELASARVNVLSVEQIATRLDDRFALLNDSPRDAPPHHQTLRAAMDWSFELLTPPEQVLFRRLAVFAGGCSIDVVEAVCADAVLPQAQIAATLFSLVNKSLLVAETLSSGAARYHYLETLREYAHGKLKLAGEAIALRNRFLDHFAGMAEETAPKLRGPYQKLWLNWTDRELDNYRAALEIALATRQTALGLQLSASLYPYWLTRGALQEGLNFTEPLLLQANELAGTADAVPEMVRLRATVVAGHFSGLLGIHSASIVYARQLVDLAQALGDSAKPYHAQALLGLGSAIRAIGDYAAALDLEQQSEQLYRALDDRAGLEFVLQMQGVTYLAMGEYATARRLLNQALELAQELGDPFRIAGVTNSLGDAARCQGAYPRAIESYETALALYRQIDARRDAAGVLTNLGYAHLHAGQRDTAQEFFRVGLDLQVEVGNTNGIAAALAGFAALALDGGAPALAASFMAASEAQNRAKSFPYPFDRIEHDYYTPRIRAALTAKEWDTAQNIGQHWSLDHAIQQARQLAALDGSKLASGPAALSPREREIVALLAEGKTNSEIAAMLVLSTRTVEKHVANILAKLELTNRTQIAHWAAAHSPR